MAKSPADPEVSQPSTPPVSDGELDRPPQRGGVWLDLLIGGLILVILLGGIGKAFSDSDLFAQPAAVAGATTEACPAGGCVKPPDEVCSDRPYKAIVTPDGKKLYYAPAHPGYQGIIAIHVERGDRWFCTEAGAAEAGFLPAP